MFAPADESVQAVRDWLTTFGIHDSRVVHSDNKGWLAFDATVEEAEKLLLTEYYEHEHRHSPSIRVGCDEYEASLFNLKLSNLLYRYHVPEHLQPHIDYITPGIKLTPVVKRDVKVERRTTPTFKKSHHMLPPPENWHYKPPGAGSLPEDVQGCGVNMTPPCWRALYGIPEGMPASKGNSLGLFEQGDYFAKSDIKSYFELFSPNVPLDTLPIPALIDGANFSVPAYATDLDTGESDIDLDIA